VDEGDVVVGDGAKTRNQTLHHPDVGHVVGQRVPQIEPLLSLSAKTTRKISSPKEITFLKGFTQKNILS